MVDVLLSEKEIERNLRWLTTNASLPVAYLTRRDLMREDPRSPQMAALWQAAADGADATAIFARQNENGSWFSGGPWGPRGYRRQSGEGFTATRPKFVTTAWILPFLGEMGFTAQDERVRRVADFLLAEMDGGAAEPANCCGLSAMSLLALASVGMAQDARLDGAWRRLIHCQREDGGWLSPHHLADAERPSTTKGRWPWDRGCVWESYYAARALHLSGSTEHAAARLAALRFLNGHLAKKPPELLRTWMYHGHNVVRELEMFCDDGMDMEQPHLQAALLWLRGYYRENEGAFRARQQPTADYARLVSGIMQDFSAEYGERYWPDMAKVSQQVLRYQLFQVAQDDWLTYRLTKLAMKMAAR